MGQYYKPLSMDKMEFVYSHSYGNGLKLMEHSYVGNNFVGVVERLIAKGGKWFGDRIVWAGDYADPETDKDDGAEHEDGNTLYSLVSENEIKPPNVDTKGKPQFRYIVNMDTKEFVDIEKIPGDDDNWAIHPLPLLTCEGNGRGGGDFRGESELVGKWARQRITVQNEKPDVDHTELIFDLTEKN